MARKLYYVLLYWLLNVSLPWLRVLPESSHSFKPFILWFLLKGVWVVFSSYFTLVIYCALINVIKQGGNHKGGHLSSARSFFLRYILYGLMLTFLFMLLTLLIQIPFRMISGIDVFKRIAGSLVVILVSLVTLYCLPVLLFQDCSVSQAFERGVAFLGKRVFETVVLITIISVWTYVSMLNSFTMNLHWTLKGLISSFVHMYVFIASTFVVNQEAKTYP